MKLVGADRPVDPPIIASQRDPAALSCLTTTGGSWESPDAADRPMA